MEKDEGQDLSVELLSRIAEFEQWFYMNPDNSHYHAFTQQYLTAWKKWSTMADLNDTPLSENDG